jgi:hypothetical protein
MSRQNSRLDIYFPKPAWQFEMLQAMGVGDRNCQMLGSVEERISQDVNYICLGEKSVNKWTPLTDLLFMFDVTSLINLLSTGHLNPHLAHGIKSGSFKF